MKDDLPLFMQSAPHNRTATSEDAAMKIRGVSSLLRARVFAYVVSQAEHGATAQEIEFALSMEGNTVRPRLVELREHKAIEDSGITRKTKAGRSAVVWKLKL